MKVKVHNFIWNILLMITVAVTLTACNGKFLSYKKTTVAQKEHRIPLQEGDTQGVWKTNELLLNYHCQRTSETLKISGTVKLPGGFGQGFSSIHRLVAQLLFLDNQGVIIQDPVLFSAESDRAVDMTPMNFERTFRIPPETTSISFSYDGMLIDGNSTIVLIGNFPS